MSLFTNSDDAVPRTRSLAAFFTSRPAAEQAKADIAALGVAAEAIKVTDGRGTVTGRSAAAEPAAGGLVDTVRNAFRQDAPEPAEEAARPGFVVTAHLSPEHHEAARAILAREGAITEE